MKSTLSQADFRKRLAQLTSKEKDIYFFTSYNWSGTPFCGKYDDNTFELTRNSHWGHVKAITIKGEYKGLDNNATEVIYTIGFTRFTRNMMVVFVCLAFIMFNTAIFYHRDTLKESLLSVFLTLNGILIFGGLWGLLMNWLAKRAINQRFKEEFEIGVVDEWERLAADAAKGISQ
ncbi:MAG TPA: hypothetical protein PLU50_10025 [Pseudobdellovibrionaceae bacterium]|nr:hypothetical protein [Pseudobdellovibrionaceae bacterium]